MGWRQAACEVFHEHWQQVARKENRRLKHYGWNRKKGEFGVLINEACS